MIGCMVAAMTSYPYSCNPDDIIKAVEANREQLMFTDVHVRGAYPKHTLNQLYEKYEIPIFIVENGFGEEDVLKDDRTIDDDNRIEYLPNNIKEMKKAI